MIVLAAAVDTRRPTLQWLVLILLVAWNVVITWARAWGRPWTRWLDLLISILLLLLAPLIAAPGSLATHPFFAAAYPMSTIATWAAEAGVWQSLAASAVLFVPLVLSRPLNDLGYDDLPPGEVISVVSGGVYYATASVTVGLFSRTLDRAAAEVRRASEEASRLREQAGRVREREALARDIHDSVLQSMALVHRRGQELAALPQVPGAEVGELVAIVDSEERSLRTLLTRAPEQLPEGTVPLRTALEASAHGITGVPMTISTAGPMWIRADVAEEIASAVRQALENVVRHARATRATVFGERDDDDVIVTVRDDGVGFEFDEDLLRAGGRLGIVHGMKGRIEGLGGEVRIITGPGRGTCVELRVPTREPEG